MVMSVNDRQKAFMGYCATMCPALNTKFIPSINKLEDSIKFTIKHASELSSFNYDPHYNYRPLIEKLDSKMQCLCFIYWYLEGKYYYTNKVSAKDCTKYICKLLNIDNREIINSLYKDKYYS